MIHQGIQLADGVVADFCIRHHIHIRRLALFGSVLRDDFRRDSDVDVLVEFAPGHTPGFAFLAMEEELSNILGRPIGLDTRQFLSPLFRDQIRYEDLYVAD